MGDKRFDVVDHSPGDQLDAFPVEDRPPHTEDAGQHRALFVEHPDVIDRIDRAIAHDSVALPPPIVPAGAIRATVVRSPSPALLFAFAAAVGWGAFLFERNRSLPPEANPTAAIAAESPAPLEAKPLLPGSEAARVVMQVRPTPLAATPDEAPDARLAEAASPPPLSIDVSGAWVFQTRTTRSAKVTTQHLHVELTQTGRRVSGIGRPVTEAGAEIGSGARSPIRVRGTIDGRQLNLTFSDAAAKSRSSQRFVLQPLDTGHLRGRVISARSTGTAEARRR
jgi:hypothetical protein